MEAPNGSAAQSVRPMSAIVATAYFGVPCLLFLVLQQYVVPAMVAAGVPHPVSFMVSGLPLVLMFVGAFVGYRLEGRPWSWAGVADRFRFRRMEGRDWAWALAAVAGNIGSYLAVFVGARPVVRWLYERFPEPEAIGEIFGDAETFLGHPLAGNAWLLGVFFIYYFFNVMGEELWWRGYIFPRQELTHGQRTWLIHGLLWTAFHLFSPYNALMVLPGALWVSWIVQRRRNTWIFVISHASLNGLAMIRLVTGIWG